MKFPDTRMRRLRNNDSIRKLLAENRLSTDELVYPVFLIEGKNKKDIISSMPDVERFSIDLLLKEIADVKKLGIKSILLFGVTDKKLKDSDISKSASKDGFVQRGISEIKNKFPDMVVAVDVCLCGYTESGHCGIIKDEYVDNDKSVEALSELALSYALSGADIVAPSAMMDGMVRGIRKALEDNGLKNTLIMSYSAKYASAFYGPFRDMAESAPSFGDRKSYQMPPSNSREAMREIELDIKEGADIVMVKPALMYLDVISKAKERFNMPLAAYNVSGEYSMIKFACKNGLLDERSAVMETLLSIKRAGADIIITYFAKDILRMINE